MSETEEREWEARQKKLRSEIQAASDSVNLRWSGCDCFIPRERIDTAEKMLACIDFLCEKEWMDCEKIRMLIRVVATRYDIPIDRRRWEDVGRVARSMP